MNEIMMRAIFGLLYVAVIVLSLRVFPESAPWLFLLFSGLCIREVARLHSLMIRKSIPFYLLWAFAWLTVFFPAYSILFTSLTTAALLISVLYHKATWRIVYVLQPFILAIAAIQAELITHEIVLFVFATIWLNDTGAYLSGKTWGKTLLAPNVSPKKTWEGFAGGIVLAVASQWVFFPYIFSDFQPLYASIAAVFIGSAATLGDLIQSRMKRKAGVKDSGNILPGHGGAFDRLDSFIFAMPVTLVFYLALSIT